MSEQIEKVEAVPFDNDMTKPEMIEHLRQVHNITTIRVGWGQARDLTPNTKVTKDELISYHERLHAVLDRDDLSRCDRHGRPEAHGDWYLAPGTGTTVPVPVVEHIHRSILSTASDVQKERLERAKNGERITDKPLSQSERKVLLELINNDFGSTKQQMQEMAADALNQTLRDLKDRHNSNKDAEAKFRAGYDKVVNDARNKIAEMKDALRGQGVVVSNYEIGTGQYGNSLRFSYEAYDREVKRAKQENQQMLERALMTLERQRLAAVRRVLIHGITEQAEKLLNEVPTAREMMVEAASEDAKKQITAS